MEIVPSKDVTIPPEILDVVNTYLQTQSLSDTARIMDMPEEEVSEMITNKQVRDYIDNVWLDSGYRNRFKLMDTLDKIVQHKMEEAEEDDFFSGKDALTTLKEYVSIMEKMVNIQKAARGGPEVQVNQQNNYYGENYQRLIQALKE